jgi:hypothetical protein
MLQRIFFGKKNYSFLLSKETVLHRQFFCEKKNYAPQLYSRNQFFYIEYCVSNTTVALFYQEQESNSSIIRPTQNDIQSPWTSTNLNLTNFWMDYAYDFFYNGSVDPKGWFSMRSLSLFINTLNQYQVEAVFYYTVKYHWICYMTSDFDPRYQWAGCLPPDRIHFYLMNGISNVADFYDATNNFKLGYYTFNRSHLMSFGNLGIRLRYPSIFSLTTRVNPNSSYLQTNPSQVLMEIVYPVSASSTCYLQVLIVYKYNSTLSSYQFDMFLRGNESDTDVQINSISINVTNNWNVHILAFTPFDPHDFTHPFRFSII